MTTIAARLDEFAAPIARAMPGDGPLGIGLWLPDSAAAELTSDDDVAALGDWLHQRRLFPFTINGFPFDNFHLPVVKHRVYEPTWADERRLRYTIALANILASLHRQRGSELATISTLPIGWPSIDDVAVTEAAGRQLRELATQLHAIERRTGVRVIVAIEPEPGCMIDTCDDLARFFASHLPDSAHRKYIGVCHDICHSAVMFEPQRAALATYRDAGILVAKVQVSSAIAIRLGELDSAERAHAMVRLSAFAEDRYLHQTGCLGHDGSFRLIEDLPLWLASDEAQRDTEVRVHFHVPIFRDGDAPLRSTQDAIIQCVAAMREPEAPDFTGHWEIETYAWTVMPEAMRGGGLGADIARELDWFRQWLL